MPHEVVFLSDHDVSDMVTMADAMTAVEEDFNRQAVPGSMIYGCRSLIRPTIASLDTVPAQSAIIRDLPVGRRAGGRVQDRPRTVSGRRRA